MTRSVALADDAYETLKTLKREDESFSDVVRRLGKDENKKALASLAGAWKNRKDIDIVLKQIRRDREQAVLRY